MSCAQGVVNHISLFLVFRFHGKIFCVVLHSPCSSRKRREKKKTRVKFERICIIYVFFHRKNYVKRCKLSYCNVSLVVAFGKSTHKHSSCN